LVAMAGCLYATRPAGVYVNLYHSSTLHWHLESGTGLELRQETKYPWEGEVALTITPAAPSDFSVYLRIPAWSRKTSVAVGGKPAPGTPKPGEYFAFQRVWKPGDVIRVQFDMTPRAIAANPRVREDSGRVAVQRGPLVYCLEHLDLTERQSVFDVSLPLGADPGKGFTAEFRPGVLGGVVVLHHRGMVTPKTFSQLPLYETLGRPVAQAGREIDLTLIPYYAWANRIPGPMEVWIPYTSAR